jgi:hypothetical protein
VALNQTMAQIDKLKRETQTPQQVLQELPKYLPLPEPITMASAGGVGRGEAASGDSTVLGPESRSLLRVWAGGDGAGVGVDEKESRTSGASDASHALNSVAVEAGIIRKQIERRLAPGTGCANGEQDGAQRDSSSGRSREPDPHTDGSDGGRSAGSPQDVYGNAAGNDSGQGTGRFGAGSSLPDAPQAATHPAPATVQAPSSQQSACFDDYQVNHSNANSPSAVIPGADLKPLYDYVQDCRACQTQLSAAKQNHLDDSTKLAALTRERDAAITASKGGSFWRRLNRNATWFAIGAAAATAAARGAAFTATYRHATR